MAKAEEPGKTPSGRKRARKETAKDPAGESAASGGPKGKEAASGEKRGGGPKALSAVALKAARPYLARRGLAEDALLKHWPEVAGPLLSSRVWPVRLQRPRQDPAGTGGGGGGGGTLHVAADGGAVALELQHRMPMLIERINGALGYRAVSRITVHQGHGVRPQVPRRKTPPPLSDARRKELDLALETVEDDALRAALRRLGEAVGRRNGGGSTGGGVGANPGTSPRGSKGARTGSGRP